MKSPVVARGIMLMALVADAQNMTWLFDNASGPFNDTRRQVMETITALFPEHALALKLHEKEIFDLIQTGAASLPDPPEAPPHALITSLQRKEHDNNSNRLLSSAENSFSECLKKKLKLLVALVGNLVDAGMMVMPYFPGYSESLKLLKQAFKFIGDRLDWYTSPELTATPLWDSFQELVTDEVKDKLIGVGSMLVSGDFESLRLMLQGFASTLLQDGLKFMKDLFMQVWEEMSWFDFMRTLVTVFGDITLMAAGPVGTAIAYVKKAYEWYDKFESWASLGEPLADWLRNCAESTLGVKLAQRYPVKPLPDWVENHVHIPGCRDHMDIPGSDDWYLSCSSWGYMYEWEGSCRCTTGYQPNPNDGYCVKCPRTSPSTSSTSSMSSTSSTSSVQLRAQSTPSTQRRRRSQRHSTSSVQVRAQSTPSTLSCNDHTDIPGSSRWWSCGYSNMYTSGRYCRCGTGFEADCQGYCSLCSGDTHSCDDGADNEVSSAMSLNQVMGVQGIVAAALLLCFQCKEVSA